MPPGRGRPGAADRRIIALRATEGFRSSRCPNDGGRHRASPTSRLNLHGRALPNRNAAPARLGRRAGLSCAASILTVAAVPASRQAVVSDNRKKFQLHATKQAGRPY